jgi:hypothetical protein
MDHRKGWIWVCLKIIRIVTVNHWILGYHIFFDKTIWVVVRINNIRKKTGFGGLDFDLPSAIYVLWLV